MNFLTVVLCLAMNEPYQAYYFVPLVSYWFAIQYAFTAVPPVVTAKSSDGHYVQYLYMVAKIVVALAVVSVFHISEVSGVTVFVFCMSRDNDFVLRCRFSSRKFF